MRCWHTGDDIAVVSFKSRMHTIGEDVLDGMLQAIEIAERDFSALVIWQTEPPFSLGANLKREAGPSKKQAPSTFGRVLRSLRREAESLADRIACRTQ